MVLSASDLEAALPDVTSSLHAAALDGQVTIVRDGFGVPHIKVRASPPVLRIFAPAPERAACSSLRPALRSNLLFAPA